MLLKLLKAAFARRAPQAAAITASPASAPPASPTPTPTPAAAPISNLDLLSRLASLASGQPLQVTGKEAPSDAAAGAARTELPIETIVAHAAALRRDALDAESEARVASLVPAFADAARAAQGLNVFLFHVDMPAGAAIDYVDAKLVPQHFDYLDILRRCIGRVRSHCPDATVFLATAQGARHRALAAPGVKVVELPLDPTRPMYERACALLAYLRSPAFTRDTVFLDADALVNRPLEAVFDLGFDIGLTYRDGPRLMPANEGVMFLAARRPQAVRRFFERRLATYDAVAADAFIGGYYGDVKRWRGGQLSLNAMVHAAQPFSPYAPSAVAGAELRFLPCDTFNFSGGEGEAASSLDRLDERFVVHFKGLRKYAFAFAAKAERTQGAAH
ncbi:MAG: hypothetical protein AMJ64_11645 [Betaproteobacteria bacterium SG8_39]|nr:MAG: hypothetical protein AMJ64_11645 [Betaproteobacteria bacterium SG8_39]